MSSPFDSLIPLIEKKSNIKDPAEFQSVINVVFHDHEAKYYDALHSEMWQSLPAQYELLVNDIHPHFSGRTNLKLLDVGCGTGLATKMLLDSPINKHIAKIDFLDTSSVMLEQAAKRAKNWSKEVNIIHGDISQAKDIYDIVVISSVLHHIPDLSAFLNKVSALQNDNGIILTIHDPTQEALQSQVYKERCEQYKQFMQLHPYSPSLKKRLINKIKRWFGPKDYIKAINQALLNANVIKEALDPVELWSVTDIHVEDLPYSASNGISLSNLKDFLPDYKLLSYRTYAFFGLLSSHLPEPLKKEEQELSIAGDKNGRNFASAWIKGKN